MELAELASLFKSIASFGVLVAVVYLAVQLRNQNRLARWNNQQSLGKNAGFPGLDPRLGSPQGLMDPLAGLKPPPAGVGRPNPAEESGRD